MKRPLCGWIETGIPVSPVNHTLKFKRSKFVKNKFSIMEIGQSIVWPYCRDTCVPLMPKHMTFKCHQINEYQFRYWRIK